MRLEVRPTPLREARAFVGRRHRHAPVTPKGALFAVSLVTDEGVVAVGICPSDQPPASGRAHRRDQPMLHSRTSQCSFDGLWGAVPSRQGARLQAGDHLHGRRRIGRVAPCSWLHSCQRIQKADLEPPESSAQ